MIQTLQEWEPTNPPATYIAGGNLLTAFVQAISHLYCCQRLLNGQPWLVMQDVITEYRSALKEIPW